MIFPRCIYAILMAKDSNCAQNKLKFHTAKKWKWKIEKQLRTAKYLILFRFNKIQDTNGVYTK